MNPADGKLIIKSSPKCLKYLCLNPAIHLKRLIDQADKIVLASGTLEPTEEYDVLSKYMPCSSFMYKFSCDHVISQNNYKAVIISNYTASNMTTNNFDFRFSSRESPT